MPSRTAVAVSLAAFACVALAAVALWGFGRQGARKADDGAPGPARVASEAQPLEAEPNRRDPNEPARAAAPAERSVAAAHGRVVNQDGGAVAGALVHLVPTGRSAERVAGDPGRRKSRPSARSRVRSAAISRSTCSAS